MNSMLTILRKAHQWYWQRKERILLYLRCLCVQNRYRRICRRVSGKFGKIKVVFPVSNISKWKMQPLFDLMLSSSRFDPLFVITAMDIENGSERVDVVKARFNELVKMCVKRNMPYDFAYDLQSSGFKSFAIFDPDIVWYQQPWGIDPIQDTYEVSKYALTCYVPYFVQNYGDLCMDCQQFFHRYLWRHFALNSYWASEFMKAQGKSRAGLVVGCGHPALDVFDKLSTDKKEDGYVIYAPHWSCGVGECYSTFQFLGRAILEFAEKHKEVRWVFKPHPTLRVTLVNEKIMSQREVDDYYAAWESIGTACYDGGYIDYFKDSRAMITDCGSFLVEYACTGRPIIHLIAPNPRIKVHPIAQELFNTYYKVKDKKDLESVFHHVILEHEDSLCDIRIAKVRQMNLVGTNASDKILEYIAETLGTHCD